MASVFADKFYQISYSEAFSKSQCIRHEHSIVELLFSMLTHQGYNVQDSKKCVWQKEKNTVIVCLVDDFTVYRTDFSVPVSQCFDSNTVVITDNFVNLNTQYTVLRLPDSFLGTFNYVPDPLEFNPDKRFSFSVNRLDQQRELILLELITQSGGLQSWMDLDHANFNCYSAYGSNNSAKDIKNNFLTLWNTLTAHHSAYQPTVQQLLKQLPIRTHQLTIEQAHVSAYVTLVVETYSGDTVITFSEKTVRALLTPAPWTLFGCFGAVDRLIDLGFDVLSDIVDHGYNKAIQQDSPDGIEKIRTYVTSSIEIYKKLASMNQQQLKIRCKNASQHNQQRLSQLQRRWPQDFANWLPTAISKTAGK